MSFLEGVIHPFLLQSACTQACWNKAQTLKTNIVSRMAADCAFSEHRQVHEQDYFCSCGGSLLPCFGHQGGASLGFLGKCVLVNGEIVVIRNSLANKVNEDNRVKNRKANCEPKPLWVIGQNGGQCLRLELLWVSQWAS